MAKFVVRGEVMGNSVSVAIRGVNSEEDAINKAIDVYKLDNVLEVSEKVRTFLENDPYLNIHRHSRVVFSGER